MIFRGTFEHALDAKHRLTVPSKFRAALSAGVVLAVSPETTAGSPRAVAIWTPEGYEAYTSQVLGRMNPLSPDTRDLRRMLFANSFDTELDSAYRVMIPQRFLDYAGLSKDVVVIGAGECLEVWDRSVYAPYNEGVLSRFPDIAASVPTTQT